MSELKVRTAYSIAMEEEDLESSGTTLVYLKSEADRVIAEKDAEIARLKEAQRWRNAAKETPTDGTEVPVILDNGWKTTDYFEEDKGRWHYHWNTVAYWFQIPKAPEEGK